MMKHVALLVKKDFQIQLRSMINYFAVGIAFMLFFIITGNSHTAFPAAAFNISAGVMLIILGTVIGLTAAPAALIRPESAAQADQGGRHLCLFWLQQPYTWLPWGYPSGFSERDSYFRRMRIVKAATNSHGCFWY